MPAGCQPPTDQQIAAILEEYEFCRGCSIKLKSEENNIYRYKKNNEVVLCEECFRVTEPKKQKGYTLVEVNIKKLMD